LVTETSRRSWISNAGLLAGPLLAAAVGLGGQLDPQRPEINAAAAVTVLMAVWWLTEALPLPATALVPLVLFPALRVLPMSEVAPQYADATIFLFFGGFLVALGIEESGLHRRIALRIVAAMGDHPRRIVLGFMLATALLSMWLSNTATALMLLPIATSVVTQAEKSSGAASPRGFAVALLLGIAYAASIGGFATLVGTPPNAAFLRHFAARFPEAPPPVTFGGWMLLAVPLSLALLTGTWWLLVGYLFRVPAVSMLGGRDVIGQQLAALGPMRPAEWRMLILFLVTAALWITREPVEGWGWAVALGLVEQTAAGSRRWVDDATVAVGMGLLCFIIPRGGGQRQPLLTWEAARRLPWGVLLLFGGGVALADGMTRSGLAAYLGQRLSQLMADMAPLGMTALVTSGVTFLTELTSNLATVNMICPVLADAAVGRGIDPRLLMVPATLAASCAFMLPVATPPNAIVYSSGHVRMYDMARAGLLVNLLSIALVTLAVYALGAVLLGFSVGTAAEWLK
jgi:sodium-dependent dicarboxylate transporter 2/3/5